MEHQKTNQVIPPWTVGVMSMMLTMILGLLGAYRFVVFKSDFAVLAPWLRERGEVLLSIRTNTEMARENIEAMQLLNEKLLLEQGNTVKNAERIAVITAKLQLKMKDW